MSRVVYLSGSGESFLGSRQPDADAQVSFVNLAFLCGECGDIWARAIWENDSPLAGTPFWLPVTGKCPKCGGGLLITFPPEQANFDLLLREILLELSRIPLP